MIKKKINDTSLQFSLSTQLISILNESKHNIAHSWLYQGFKENVSTQYQGFLFKGKNNKTRDYRWNCEKVKFNF